jgi:hypothetical protein
MLPCPEHRVSCPVLQIAVPEALVPRDAATGKARVASVSPAGAGRVWATVAALTLPWAVFGIGVASPPPPDRLWFRDEPVTARMTTRAHDDSYKPYWKVAFLCKHVRPLMVSPHHVLFKLDALYATVYPDECVVFISGRRGWGTG